MKTIHSPNKIRSHFGHILTNGAVYSKMKFKVETCSALIIFDSHPALILLNPNNHYNHGFYNTLDYNHFINSD